MHTTHALASRGTMIVLLALAVTACGSDTSTSLEPTGDVGGELRSSRGTNTTASRCNGTIGAISVQEVNVPNGAICMLNGTRVRGDVKVRSGASLLTSAARVDGNIQAEDALTVSTRNATFVIGDVQVKGRATARIENTTINGNLQIEELGSSLVSIGNRIGGDLQVRKARTSNISFTHVDGNIQLEENIATQGVSDVNVKGNLQVFKNRARVRLDRNRVAQSLQCKENSPAPTGGSNIAGGKEDQCRRL